MLTLVCFATTGNSWAGYALSDQRRLNEITQTEFTLSFVGQLTPQLQQGTADITAVGNKSIHLAATAKMSFHERFTESFRSGISAKSIRFYETAAVNINVGGETLSTALAEENQLICIDRVNGRMEPYAIAGNLTRWELDLIDTPAKTYSLYGLLPNCETEIGDCWQPNDDQVANFLNLDMVSRNHCHCEFIKVEKNVAMIQVRGTVVGNIQGVPTEIELSGEYRFDLVWKRINWCQLKLTEVRADGYAAPGFRIRAEIRVLNRPVSSTTPEAQQLLALKVAPDIDPHNRMWLRFEDIQHDYTFLNERRWWVMDDRSKATTLRFVDNNELIAQCHISRLSDLPAGKQLGLEEYQNDIKQSLGDNFGHFESARQDMRQDGYIILRVSAVGAVGDVPVRWLYYHIASPVGRRATFMMSSEVKNADLLNESDHLLVNSFRFAPGSATNAYRAEM